MVNVRILDNGTLSFEGIEAPLFQIPFTPRHIQLIMKEKKIMLVFLFD